MQPALEWVAVLSHSNWSGRNYPLAGSPSGHPGSPTKHSKSTSDRVYILRLEPVQLGRLFPDHTQFPTNKYLASKLACPGRLLPIRRHIPIPRPIHTLHQSSNQPTARSLGADMIPGSHPGRRKLRNRHCIPHSGDPIGRHNPRCAYHSRRPHRSRCCPGSNYWHNTGCQIRNRQIQNNHPVRKSAKRRWHSK